MIPAAHERAPRPPSWSRALGITFALACVPWLMVAAALGLLPAPPRGSDPQRCSRACHDHGCPHPPSLPASLTSDEGLYGATIRQLRAAGRATGLGARRGYGLVNLLVFCLLWPLFMAALLLVAIHQRQRIRALRPAASERQRRP